MRRAKNKGEVKQQTAIVDTLSHEGRGVARVLGKATFIQGALPGEEVLFQYTKTKKDWDEGFVVSLIKSSPLRVSPPCPHYALCGGCSLQHVSPEAQINLKQEHLLDLFSRFAHTEPQNILPPLTGAFWHYRNKARLSVRFVEKKQAALVGFRERNNPRYITDINQCPILHTKVHEHIVPLKELVQSLEDKQCIAQIEVAAGDEEVALIFRNLRPLNEQDAQALETFGKRYEFKMYLQPAGPDSVDCIYPQGADPLLSYRLIEQGIKFAFHPTDFTQVNASINPSMVNSALQLMDLQPTDKVLDLFCGLGNFSLPMAKYCAKVVGVEGSEIMVERAKTNALANGISNTDFFAANLDDVQVMDRLIPWGVNKVLLDPPRSGALELVRRMDSIGPSRIVYISCNPLTLARDTDLLVNQKGYVLKSAGVMDMFPHTSHVESIALFEKG